MALSRYDISIFTCFCSTIDKTTSWKHDLMSYLNKEENDRIIITCQGNSLPCSSLFLTIWSKHESFPTFLPDVLCDPTGVIWRKRSPFETMTGRTAPSLDCLLAEVFRGFPQDLCTASNIISFSPIISNRCNSRDTQGKWPLVRNPEELVAPPR